MVSVERLQQGVSAMTNVGCHLSLPCLKCDGACSALFTRPYVRCLRISCFCISGGTQLRVKTCVCYLGAMVLSNLCLVRFHFRQSNLLLTSVIQRSTFIPFRRSGSDQVACTGPISSALSSSVLQPGEVNHDITMSFAHELIPKGVYII